MTDITPRTSAHTIFSFESTSVRTFADDHGEPWFLANDVCAVLGYKQPRDAVSKHCREGGVAKRDTPTDSGIQEMTWINEGNLYRLIIKSRKPEAERFEQWVMEEVLPTIRKTGQYVAQPYAQNPTDTLTANQAELLRQMLTDAAKLRHPGDGKKQGVFLMRGWSKLKAHFKRGYREIPQVEFAEAVSLVARHIAEQGELLEPPAQPPADMITKEHAMRCLALVSSLTGPAHLVAFNQLLDQSERDLKFGRFLLAFNGNTPIVKAIEEDAVVFSWREAPRLLLDPGMPIDTDTLKAIAAAVVERLSRRIPARNALHTLG